MEKNITADHMAKAVVALIGATISVVTFWIKINTNTEAKIISIAIAALTVIAVWRRENAPEQQTNPSIAAAPVKPS